MATQSLAWLGRENPQALTLLEKIRSIPQKFGVAGERFTAADITAFLGYFDPVGYGALKFGERSSLSRWYEELVERGCMSMLREMAATFGMLTRR
ncbi:MAG: hypothetical protein KGO02_12265 [Alphaproteobacteria bacterium]|nr:hypothetical protein [Alphaproteobacteria bacterium]